MSFHLETARLRLRSFNQSDLEAFVAYRSDPLVAQYQGWDAPYPRLQAESFIDEMENAMSGVPGFWCQVAIELKATSRLIGDVGVFTRDGPPLQAELGFTLAREYQGQGYATEAVRRVITYLFQEIAVHRVIAMCDVRNQASFQFMERIGMRREAHYIENSWFKHAWSSEYLYAVLAREWQYD